MKERMLKVGAIRRLYLVLQRFPPFFEALFSERGLGSRDGRQLVIGKARRILISFFPPLARALQKHYGLKGGCANCGASCRLLFQCPHLNGDSKLCSVYEDRPTVCRLFPITPGDIRDRELVGKKGACGFTFSAIPAKKPTTESPALVPAVSPINRFQSNEDEN